jgi:hypothetical protein
LKPVKFPIFPLKTIKIINKPLFIPGGHSFKK